MAILLADPQLEADLRKQRREAGADKFDEVWDGVYVMHAYPGDEHQELVGGLTHVFWEVVQAKKLGRARPGVNIASDPADWTNDYRCPDVAVFLNDTAAECHGAFWTSADFVVEVVSQGDESRNKLAFYAKVGVRELLLVDRDPWRLEMHRLGDKELKLSGVTRVGDAAIASDILPLAVHLEDDPDRPLLVVTHQESGQVWKVYSAACRGALLESSPAASKRIAAEFMQ